MSIDNKELLGLIDDGLKGNLRSLQLRANKLASKLKKTDPELSLEISKKAGDLSALRFASSMMESSPPQKTTPVDTDTRLSLLLEEYPVTLDDTPAFSNEISESIHQVILERQKSDLLISKGLTPVRTIIFEGPPGVGKTLTARWLANSLDLPLLTLDLATVMSSFLGKTGSNIKSVLEYASSFPCILFLDEFDAIAKKRNDESEVGELKRLVNVLLQSIDLWPHSSILVAATNHSELLDPAVWRRFDVNIKFGCPSKDLISKYISHIWPDYKWPSFVPDWLHGMSFSDIKRLVLSAKKANLLENKPVTAYIFSKLSLTQGKSTLINKKTLAALMHREGYSQRAIERETGLSRPTIKKAIDEALEQGWI